MFATKMNAARDIRTNAQLTLVVACESCTLGQALGKRTNFGVSLALRKEHHARAESEPLVQPGFGDIVAPAL